MSNVPDRRLSESKQQPFHVLIIGAGKNIVVQREDLVPASARVCLRLPCLYNRAERTSSWPA